MGWVTLIMVAYIIPLIILLCFVAFALFRNVSKNSDSEFYRAYFGRLQFVYRRKPEKTAGQEWQDGADQQARKVVARHMLRSRRHID